MKLEDYKVKDILEYLKDLNFKFENEYPIISEIQESFTTIIDAREKERINNNELLHRNKITYSVYIAHLSETEGLKRAKRIVEGICLKRMIK